MPDAATTEPRWTPEAVGYIRAVKDGANRLVVPEGQPGPLTDYWRRVLTDLLDTVKELTDAAE